MIHIHTYTLPLLVLTISVQNSQRQAQAFSLFACGQFICWVWTEQKGTGDGLMNWYSKNMLVIKIWKKFLWSTCFWGWRPLLIQSTGGPGVYKHATLREFSLLEFVFQLVSGTKAVIHNVKRRWERALTRCCKTIYVKAWVSSTQMRTSDYNSSKEGTRWQR